VPETAAGADKFRILGQLQLARDHGHDPFGLGGFDLAFDGSVFDRAVLGRQFGLRPCHPLGVDDHVRLSGIFLRVRAR